MTKTRATLLLSITAATFTLAGDAGAGSVDTRPVTCVSYKSGGECRGTLRGFRRASDPEAFAQFVENGSSLVGAPPRQFLARLGTFYGSCDIPEDVSDVMLSRLMTNPDLYFWVSWSAPDYECTINTVAADSRLVDVPIVLP